MAESIAVLLVHSDGATQSWIREALSDGQFSVVVRTRVAEPQRELAALHPRVLLADATLLAESPLRDAALALDPPCLLLGLVAPGAGISAGEALDLGADDAVLLPLADATLRAKLRAGLRLVQRLQGVREVRGEIGPDGPLGIIKHCEDHRLNGRLIVEGEGRSFSAVFFGGELVSASSEPPPEDGDDLAALMSLREGCYLFVQSAVDPLARTPSAGTGGAPDGVPLEAASALAPPMPIVTKVKGSSQGIVFEVRTAGENRPHLTISTVILRDGRELRRMETGWPHPIASDADLAQAWAQMVQQHERVMAKLREVTESLRRAPSPNVGVDGTLLSWALHFVVEQAWADLGTTVTANLLGRTQRALALRWPHLAHFRVGERAQVTFDLGRGPTLVPDAVDAVAEWLAAFLYLARRIAPGLTQLDVRQSTILMAATLEAVGFYGAFARATTRIEREGFASGSSPGSDAPPPAGRAARLP